MTVKQLMVKSQVEREAGAGVLVGTEIGAEIGTEAEAGAEAEAEPQSQVVAQILSLLCPQAHFPFLEH